MKKLSLIVGVLGAVLTTQQLPAITLSFANISTANVEFLGSNDTFHFNPNGAGDQFRITGSDGVGDSLNDLGRINGTFHIGAITIHPGGLQTAPVTGGGSIVIHDGVNDLTASVFWNQIQTSGTAGSLNLLGVLNLASITYGGTQNDLHHLALPSVGEAVLSFTFIPARSLTQLTANASDKKTSFSGTFASTSIPDGGATVMLLGMGLTGLALAARRKA